MDRTVKKTKDHKLFQGNYTHISALLSGIPVSEPKF